MEWLETWFPNVLAYWDKFMESCIATLQMFLIGGGISLLIGFFFGVVLVIARPGGIRENRTAYRALNFFINTFRSVPFIILLIFLIPFTRLLMGTAIGVKGAVVPLCFGCVPFFTRQVETALSTVDPGKVEAARAMGSGTAGIVLRVYLHEAVPNLIRVITITAISLIGLTTMAGAVGAGGIGSFAINYGQNLHHQDIVNVCVILLLIIVSVMQTAGSTLAARTTNRALFRKGGNTK
ncbi:MAG: ABC transporter permease [Solobacterium sp.]|nr:ABC transporter permease [Solobacterium sp.]MBQ1320271.1 ABC transporter permease [Solobacterium sp.]MBQ1356855.1 ABC transporter permease [Solobacterium sp.]